MLRLKYNQHIENSDRGLMSYTTPPKNVLAGADTAASEQKRAIAYSMDLLIPGLYIWLGSFTIRLFGSQPEDEPYKYPGVLNSNYGIALVLPGYRILTTYRNSYDPR